MADTPGNFKIGIIGGCGKMGRLFENFFKKKDYEVLISDLSCGIPLEELISKAKVIIISVPMDCFEAVIKEISPLVNESHWVMDICSLKKEPIEIMKSHLKCTEILGTHPLFGPYEKDLKGKIMALCPVKGKDLLNWAKKTFSEEGLKVVEVSPEKHDEIMGVVQTLNHFWLVLLANLIKELDLNIEDLVNLSTPSFLKQLLILKRLARQDENLYARIQFDNPAGNKIREKLCNLCEKLVSEFQGTEKEEAFKKYFLQAKEIAKELEKLLKI